MKGVFFSCLLTLLCGGMLFAQDLSKEFQQIYSKLDQLKTFQFVVDYSSNDTSEFKEEGGISVLFTPDGYFYQTNFCELVINKGNTILIDEDERIIRYSQNEELDKSVQSVTTGMLLNQIDTLVTKADSVYFSFDGLDRVYYLRFANQYFNLVEMRFSGDMLKHIDYYYNSDFVGTKGLKVSNKITLNTQPVFDPNILRTDFYFVEKDNQIIPKEDFASYRIEKSESVNSILK